MQFQWDSVYLGVSLFLSHGPSGFLIIECNCFYLLSCEYFQIWFCLLGVYSLAPWPSPTRLLNLACVLRRLLYLKQDPLSSGALIPKHQRPWEILLCRFRYLRPSLPAVCYTTDLKNFLMEEARCAFGAPLANSLLCQLSQPSQIPLFLCSLADSCYLGHAWALVRAQNWQMPPVKEVVVYCHWPEQVEF